MMFKKILLSGLMVVSSSAVVWAQVPRTSTTSTSAVSSSRTSAGGQSGSSMGGSSMGSAMSSDFQPIERGGFVGRSQQGTGFVGRSSSGTSGSGMSGSRGMSSMGMGGMGMGMGGMGMSGMGGMGMGGMGGSNRMGGFNSTQNQNSQTKIRTTMRLGFRYARPNVQAVSQRVQGRWVRLPVSDSIKGVSMNFENGVATLTGKVATAEEKRMAEKLILLEPGVSSVQNQLEVTAAEAETP
jgi:osmotically-inducible protein OsmY